jgi:CubicO group peptidase (beta-lactamase class C family)
MSSTSPLGRMISQVAAWPVPHVAAAVVRTEGSVLYGPLNFEFRLASLAKVVSSWAVLIAAEEGIVSLDSPVGQRGCTLRHLLSHAGGYPFDGVDPIAAPGTRRIYSNTGIEMAAATVADAAGMSFADYVNEAVLQPLGMQHTALRGSPAHGMWTVLPDMVAFVGELLAPTLLDPSTALQARTAQFPTLRGVVPGVGSFDPCPWGLGCEIRGGKTPHWTGTTNSASTFGHFGGSGTMMWVDPVRKLGLVALTDRPFDEWSAEALRVWPKLSDDVLAHAEHPHWSPRPT